MLSAEVLIVLDSSMCKDYNISSSDSQVSKTLQVSNYFNDLLAGFLVDFNNLIILERSKHTMQFLSTGQRPNQSILVDFITQGKAMQGF